MSVISVVLSEEDHKNLQEEYQKMTAAWKQPGQESLPPTFERWLGLRATATPSAPAPNTDLDDVRVFNAIEKLVTSLRPHSFGLAHIGATGSSSAEAARALAQKIVADLQLQPHYEKRIQDLFEHYQKGAKEVADMAHVGVTNRAYGALHEAFRQLSERTAKSLPHLGDERAIGRVEGGAAILVILDTLDRESAKEKTDAFKLQVRSAARPTWTEKVFGGAKNK